MDGFRIPRIVGRGKWCPRCGGRSERARMPVLLGVVRLLFRAASFRRCACGWRGIALPS